MSQLQVRQGYSTRRYESLYDDVVQTKTYLERLRREERAVARHFEAWREHREVTIDTIDDLQKKMDIVCVTSNVVQVVGAAAGIVGLISGMAGLFLEAKEDESAEDFKKFGKYCTGAGVAAAVSSTVIEEVLNQTAINKIKRILGKDVELTKPLKNWIEFSNEVDHRLNRVFQCNIVSNLFNKVINVCGQCLELLADGEAEYQDLLFRIQTSTLKGFEHTSLEIMQKVYHTLEKIQKNPRLLQPLQEICNIFQETPDIYELVKTGVSFYNNICDILKIEPLSMMLPGSVFSSMLLTRCALDTIAIGFQVVRMIFAIQNIKEAKSRYSEALEQIKLELRMELREITSQMDDRVHKSYLEYKSIPAIDY